mmetsp:Transcript_120361/g.351630  ORF Transcript_120361/g.351630 Transcript_120361/m.351630 type:complete len:157 (-) Transcript_120361:2489-2959(-)
MTGLINGIVVRCAGRWATQNSEEQHAWRFSASTAACKKQSDMSKMHANKSTEVNFYKLVPFTLHTQERLAGFPSELPSRHAQLPQRINFTLIDCGVMVSERHIAFMTALSGWKSSGTSCVPSTGLDWRWKTIMGKSGSGSSLLPWLPLAMLERKTL